MRAAARARNHRTQRRQDRPWQTPTPPQIYLVTPTAFVPEAFGPVLARLLDNAEIACLRLALADPDADAVARAADACREIAHARDVPLVIERHAGLVERLGLDGVHLTDAARSVRAHAQGAGGGCHHRRGLRRVAP